MHYITIKDGVADRINIGIPHSDCTKVGIVIDRISDKGDVITSELYIATRDVVERGYE